MYILKNAFISIKRNIGRNVLICIIILVVSCAASVTLAIRNSANSIIKSYEEKYDIIATIQTNRESLMKNFNSNDRTSGKENIRDSFESISDITIDDIIEYGESEYVKSYYYTESIGLNSNSIETASIENNTSQSIGISGKGDSQVQMNLKNSTKSNSDFTIIGYSSYEAMEDFISGKYSIIDGEVSQEFNKNYCVINSELATINGINIGDNIEFVSPNDESITFDFIVTGIFQDTDNSADTRMQMFSSSANTIITNTDTIENIVKKDSNISKSINPSFVLTSKEAIEDFTNEVKNKGLDNNLMISTNLENVESSTESISNLKTFALVFLIITLLIGAVVLFVISMINIKERKYEIGVLRTIGMSKCNLTLQFVIELLIVTLISLLIGCAIGALISVPTANKLLENEIQSSQESQENVMSNFGQKSGKEMMNVRSSFNGVSNIEPVSSINAVVDIKVLFELLGIGILLTIIISVVSMISIQRFSPLTILKERS